MPDTLVHRIRSWSGRPVDEAPICGASSSWEVTSDRTVYPHYVTCPKCNAVSIAPIIAYTERDSIDPQTGEEGITRTEWRIVEGVHHDPYSHRPRGLRIQRVAYSNFRLDRKTTRRGEDLGWEHLGVHGSRIEALRCVDNIRSPSIVAVDKEFAEVQAVARQEVIEEKDEKLRSEAREHEANERRRQRAESEDAFRRLYQSAAGSVQADKWRAFIADASAADVAKLRADRHAVELHDAVIAAVTVPAKRKAIKVALAYYAGVLGKSSTEELSERKG